MPLGTTILAILQTVVVPLAATGGVAAIKRHKNIPFSLKSLLMTLLFPPLGIVYNLARKARPPKGRTPEEQELFDRRFSVDEKKKTLDRLEGRKERLEVYREKGVGYQLAHPFVMYRDPRRDFPLPRMSFMWFPVLRARLNDRAVENLKGDIRNEYEMLGKAQRRLEMSGLERFVSVRMQRGPDGSLRFGIPYDASREVASEIRMLIGAQFGINPNDVRTLYQSEHRSADMGGIKPGQSLLVFDAKEHRVTPFGKELPKDVRKSLNKAIHDQYVALRNAGLADGDGVVRRDACIRIDPIGKDSVALSYNGVAIAYAVAGEDGKVRAMGNSVGVGDTRGMRLASMANERLAGALTMGDWVERASRIVLSPTNIGIAREAVGRKETFSRRLKEKRAVRLNILNAPKQAVRKLGGVKL